MRQWVLDAEHMLDGSWVTVGQAVSNEQVAQRFDPWRAKLAEALTDDSLSPVAHECLAQFLQVLANLRPYLIQGDERRSFLAPTMTPNA